jgi:predicted lipoprotein with Yx(FWY)xxD motif
MGTAALLAGCSSSGGSTASASGGISERTVSGATVLADGAGQTLYTSDQERSAGKVLCISSSCTRIWAPLILRKGQQPSGPHAVTMDLSVLTRPDGTRQLAYRGAPLYVFTLDHGAGGLSGNGQHDHFDNTDFVWHAVTVNGTAPAQTSQPSSNGGYHY